MTARITIRPTHSMTQFILKAVRPEVSVNGETTRLRWNAESTVEVVSGTHDVEVYFPYMGRKSGPAQAQISVKDGEVANLSYRAPMFVTSNGTLNRG